MIRNVSDEISHSIKAGEACARLLIVIKSLICTSENFSFHRVGESGGRDEATGGRGSAFQAYPWAVDGCPSTVVRA